MDAWNQRWESEFWIMEIYVCILLIIYNIFFMKNKNQFYNTIMFYCKYRKSYINKWKLIDLIIFHLNPSLYDTYFVLNTNCVKFWNLYIIYTSKNKIKRLQIKWHTFIGKEPGQNYLQQLKWFWLWCFSFLDYWQNV